MYVGAAGEPKVAQSSLNRLSQTFVAKHKTTGLYGDGNGLYLQITASKEGDYVTKSWIFRYAVGSREKKRERKMGLGAYPLVSLAMAREMAIECSLKRLRGVDPLEEREADKRKKATTEAKTITFEKAATKYIASHEAGWRNDKHRQQWTNTLKTYAYPVFGKLDLRDIDIGLVMQVVEPIWTSVPETAGRVRGRVERILEWGKVNGYREGENPARWSGHLDHLLPKRANVRKVEHHPALPYDQMGVFMAELREQEGTAARALEFTILTAARSGESRGMRWQGELDPAGDVWKVPAERMKRKREHRVPLTAAAIAVIESMRKQRHSDWVFPGDRSGERLSDMSLTEVIRRMNEAREKAGLPRWVDPEQNNRDVVPHGFRSTFRDWVDEATNFPDWLAEAALAHAKGDKVEAAYKRGDALAKRRELMEAWATYCDQQVDDAKVIRPQFGGRA
jgi:integrase